MSQRDDRMTNRVRREWGEKASALVQISSGEGLGEGTGQKPAGHIYPPGAILCTAFHASIGQESGSQKTCLKTGCITIPRKLYKIYRFPTLEPKSLGTRSQVLETSEPKSLGLSPRNVILQTPWVIVILRGVWEPPGWGHKAKTASCWTNW